MCTSGGPVGGIERSGRLAERLGIASHLRSTNRLSSSVVGRIAGILRDSYADFGPTLVAEQLFY
jgi:hypothetical protein